MKRSQKGSKYAFVNLSDTSGSYEVTLFSEVLSAAGALLEAGTRVLLAVTAEPRLDDPSELRLTVQSVRSLADEMARSTTMIKVHVGALDAVPELRKVVASDGRGRSRLVVVPHIPAYDVEITLDGSFAAQAATVERMRSCQECSPSRKSRAAWGQVSLDCGHAPFGLHFWVRRARYRPITHTGDRQRCQSNAVDPVSRISWITALVEVQPEKRGYYGASQLYYAPAH